MRGSGMNHKSSLFGLSINHVKFELGVLTFSCTIKGLTQCVVFTVCLNDRTENVKIIIGEIVS